MGVHQLKIQPQPGPQTEFLKTRADIAIYGGAAGGGKSYSLLMESLRYHTNKKFDAVIFRRETPQITNPGGLWHEGFELFMPMGAKPNISALSFIFPSGMRIKFAHLEHEKTVYAWQGAQIPFIGFDELTHFTKKQFFYMLGRNRSMSGVPGYIRATCNPDPDSWVLPFISWWIDDNGYPITKRSGVVRWFIRRDDEIVWGDHKFHEDAKSVTFIASKLTDNQILIQKDPGYKANLEAMAYVDRMRLLHGNWKIRPAAGNYFKKAWLEVTDQIPPKHRTTVRYWDRAASESENADYTAGVKMSRDRNGIIYIEDIERFRGRPLKVQETIKNVASQDGQECLIGIEQDPGQAGVVDAQALVRLLAGYTVKLNKVVTNKVKRASPFSAYCESGNVKVLRGKWNDALFSELELFPEGAHDDQVDACSGAFNLLTQGLSGEFTEAMTSEAPHEYSGTLVSEII